jgi:C-terminal processing protease CtpA/Prc
MTTTTRNRLIDLIRENYVFPDVAERIVAELNSPELAGADSGAAPEEIAAQLTERMQSVSRDLHLRVRYRASGESEEATDWDAHYAADAVRNAGGMHRVERLDQRIGLLAIAPYMSPVHLAEHHVRAAFVLLTGVEGVVIDLREGRGGTPETVELICGHLLGNEPVHLQDIIDRDGHARQYWTSPAAGRLDDSVRVCVLTSERTFSGCEELAYNLQALQRASIIGRRTGGGAHPVEVFALSDELEVTVPTARSVNAVTGTNWEQVGVVPDIDCDPDSALDQALQLLC